MKIGIFSGSFDPIHIGHAILANYVLQWADLDEVWMMVSRRNPLKNNTVASDKERLDMVRIVSEECSGLKASDFEFSLPTPSFTYNTLSELRTRYPDYSFYLIIGSDNFVIFDKWKDYHKILEEFKIIVYPRPGYSVDESKVSKNVIVLKDAPQLIMSSTFIREALKKGKRLNFFLPEKVSNYIDNKKLYR